MVSINVGVMNGRERWMMRSDNREGRWRVNMTVMVGREIWRMMGHAGEKGAREGNRESGVKCERDGA